MTAPPNTGEIPAARLFHQTRLGEIYLGDSLALFRDAIEDHSVDLIMTSPPFGLVRKKDYGNVDADKYVEWFRPFAAAFKGALKPQGSLVIDIGAALPQRPLWQE
jgi:site-specific DNA-methyltransferase (cytosine-N4-specific)